MRRARLEVPPGYVALGRRVTLEEGARVAAALLAEHPEVTAIVAGNDLMALGVIAALRQRGIRVPEDMSVAGFDDLPAAVDVVPALTTVRLPLEQGARRAGRIASGVEDVTGPQRLWMPAELMVRESVAAPRVR